jgi:hypothetical protein
MHRSFTPVTLISLLSAGVLTFCAPHPVAAQPAATATGAYIDCKQVAADVSLMARAMKLGLTSTAWASGEHADWYTRVVTAHARKAVTTDNPAQYVRDLHKACLLETA